MESYRIYLQAYAAAIRGIHTSDKGASLDGAVAIAIASHDAMHGREPRNAASVLTSIKEMCEAVYK